MKQIWPDYSYSPTTNVLTLTGLNIDRDQLLLVAAPERGRIMYNFADSSVTASAFTSGANTALTLVATTAGLTTTAALVIYFDDQATSSTVTGTVELGPTSLNALESITVTMGQVTVTGGLTDVQLRASPVTVGGTVTVGNFPASQAVTFAAVTGSVSVLNFPASQAVTFSAVTISNFPATQTIAGTVTASLVAKEYSTGTFLPLNIAYQEELFGDGARLGVSIINDTGDEYGAGNPLPISGTVTVGNSVTIGSLPAISGTVTANTFALQGTAVTTSDFTSTTASTVLASFNATREVLTIFNEGAGNLHICAGATCTTIAYQVRLSAGDYYEVPNHQTTITHSAVFATAGTARVTEVS